MPRGGHNWKGGGTVEGARSLDVMKLARAGYLGSSRLGSWQWNYEDGETATVSILGGRDGITLSYRFRRNGGDWQSVEQRVPIRWTRCHFGGERPWFVCDVFSNGIHCGRQTAKLYGAGRLFACRNCYWLGYAIQRGGPLDRAHHNLSRLHRKLGANYGGPDRPAPPKPRWMRWATYSHLETQIEARRHHLNLVLAEGLRRIMARLERSDQRGRTRR